MQEQLEFCIEAKEKEIREARCPHPGAAQPGLHGAVLGLKGELRGLKRKRVELRVQAIGGQLTGHGVTNWQIEWRQWRHLVSPGCGVLMDSQSLYKRSPLAQREVRAELQRLHPGIDFNAPCYPDGMGDGTREIVACFNRNFGKLNLSLKAKRWGEMTQEQKVCTPSPSHPTTTHPTKFSSPPHAHTGTVQA